MPEIGIPYVITGPDGTRAVLNDDADPDFVGYLDSEKGITGLLDGAETRENGEDRVEGDGGVHGPFYEGRRAGTLQGFIWPEPDMTTVNARESKLKRATRALTADGVLSWTPSGGVARRILFRRRERPAIAGRRPKEFQVSLVAADPWVLSTAESNQVITPGAAAGEIGFSSPFSSPFGGGWQVSGAGIVTQAGDRPGPWRAVITGPISSPRLRNNTTGLELRFAIVLASGETLTVDAGAKTVVFGSSTPKYSALDFALSDWWLLAPGANDIRLLSSAYSGGAQVQMYWRQCFDG